MAGYINVPVAKTEVVLATPLRPEGEGGGLLFFQNRKGLETSDTNFKFKRTSLAQPRLLSLSVRKLGLIAKLAKIAWLLMS